MSRLVVTTVLLAVGAVALGVPASSASAAPTDPAAALGQLEASFPGVAGAFEQPSTPPFPRALDYAGDTAASAGGGRVVVSTGPLRARAGDGRVRPVDLTLAPAGDGAVAPRNAPFELRLSPDVGAFALGPDAQSAVRVEPIGTFAVTAPETGAGGLFQASTRVQADSLVVVGPDGIESFEQLRGADAPERFAWTVTPPQGARLVVLADGGLEVRRDGDALVRMLPPASVDAAGRAVPTTMTWDGSRLELVVDHRDGDFAYPILVDPVWKSAYDYVNEPATGREGIKIEQEPAAGGPWYSVGIARGAADVAGIAMIPIGGRVFPAGASAKARIYAPGSTAIARATFTHVSHFNDRHRQTLRLMLWNGGMIAWDRSETTRGFLDQEVELTDPTASSRIAEMWLFTPPCSAGERDCPRLIPASHSTFARVGAVTLDLVDDDFPAFEAVGPLRDMAGTWSNPSGLRRADLIARDAGSGMSRFGFGATLGGTRAELRAWDVPCDPLHNTAGQDSNICPYEWRQEVEFDVGGLAEGRTTFHVAGRDFAENDSDTGGTTLSWDVFVDRSAPSIAASGDLRATSGWVNPRGRTAIDLVAGDARSGVASYGLQVEDGDGDRLLDEQVTACPSPAAGDRPCPTAHSRLIAFDAAALPEGHVRFRARATDHVGNAAPPLQWDVAIDRTGPVARASGGVADAGEGWAAVDGATAVAVEARDRGAGVRRLALEVVNADGRAEVATKTVCMADPCPARAAAEFEIPARMVADGRNEFTVVAYDAAGNRSRDGDSWDAYLDTLPPPPPSGIEIVERSDGSVQISWERPPEDGGSPISHYEYLVQPVGQPGGQWVSTPTPGVTIGELPPEQVNVLVRAVEEAGRPSAYASRAWIPRPRLPGGRGASMVEIPPEYPCWHGRYPFDRDLPGPTLGDYGRWKRNRSQGRVAEPNVRVSGSYRIECESRVRTIKAAVEVLATRRGIYPQSVASDVLTINRPPVGQIRHQDTVHGICAPGTSVYNLSVVSVMRAGDDDLMGETMSKGTTLNCNEAGAWRSRAMEERDQSGKLSRELRFRNPNYGDRPLDFPATGSTYGFEAHHIVPIEYGDNRYAAAAQRDAYLCFFEPNEARNGAFLRGPAYHRERRREAFARLPKADQVRAYHRGIHTDDHFEWLAERVNSALSAGQRCNQRHAADTFEAIRWVLTRLGSRVPGVPKSARR